MSSAKPQTGKCSGSKHMLSALLAVIGKGSQCVGRTNLSVLETRGYHGPDLAVYCQDERSLQAGHRSQLLRRSIRVGMT